MLINEMRMYSTLKHICTQASSFAETEKFSQQAYDALNPQGQWLEKIGHEPYLAFMLARIAGEDSVEKILQIAKQTLAQSPFCLDELAILAKLNWHSSLTLATERSAYFQLSADSETNDPAIALAGDPSYIHFARQMLELANQQLKKIKSGEIAFKADKAFSIDDAHLIAKAYRVAAYRDESWLGELITPLLCNVCVAPTAANSLPSQSLAIALGHSIQAIPTPESVEALQESLKIIRHAGVKKKLARNLKPAQRALAKRPEIAMRLTQHAKKNKKLESMLKDLLEAGYYQNLKLNYTQWVNGIVNSENGKGFAHSLIWVAHYSNQTSQSFRLNQSGQMITMQGEVIGLNDPVQISLWHPIAVNDSERCAWQKIIDEHKIEQSIRQVHREYYFPDCLNRLVKGSLSIRPLLGLARKEEWKIEPDEDNLRRRFGSVRATLTFTDRLFPGLEGITQLLAVSFEQQQGSQWLAHSPENIDRVLFSEICRAIDLLVSVATVKSDSAN